MSGGALTLPPAGRTPGRARLLTSDMRRLLCADLASNTGSAMATVALPWLVLAQTGSPARAGVVVTAEILPAVILGIPSGMAVTRVGPLRALVGCDAIRAVLAAALPALYWMGALPFGAIVALALGIGIFIPAHWAARQTAVASFTGERPEETRRANVLLEGASRLPLTVGPAVAAVLLTVLGAPAVLLLDGITYLVSAVILLPLATRTDAPRSTPEATSFMTGVRALWGDGLLRSITLAGAAFELAMQATFIALPLFAFTALDGDASVAALLLAGWGAGALAGVPLAFALRPRDRTGTVAIGLVCQAAPLWALALPLPPLALGFALFVSGLGNPLTNGQANAIVTLSVNRERRAQTAAAYVTVLIGSAAAGPLLAGLIASHMTVSAVFVFAPAVASMAALGFAARWRRVSRLGLRRQDAT